MSEAADRVEVCVGVGRPPDRRREACRHDDHRGEWHHDSQPPAVEQRERECRQCEQRRQHEEQVANPVVEDGAARDDEKRQTDPLNGDRHERDRGEPPNARDDGAEPGDERTQCEQRQQDAEPARHVPPRQVIAAEILTRRSDRSAVVSELARGVDRIVQPLHSPQPCHRVRRPGEEESAHQRCGCCERDRQRAADAAAAEEHPGRQVHEHEHGDEHDGSRPRRQSDSASHCRGGDTDDCGAPR